MSRPLSSSALWKVAWAPALGLLLGLLLALSLLPRAAAQGPLTVQLLAVDSADFPVVTATLSVTDANGLPVRDLPASSFRVTADGRPLPVVQVRTALDAGVGIAVVLAVDVSGSMQGDPLAKAKQVARDFVARLSPADRAMLLAFSDQVRVLQPFTANREALLQAIEGLQAGGNTALYDAVVTAAEAAAVAELPRRAVVLLSDGADFGGLSRASREGSLAAASGRGVPFFTVGLGPQPDRDYLTQLASRSQGRAMYAPTLADLPPVFEEVHALLRSQYLLGLDLGQGARAGSYNLQVEVQRGAERGLGGRTVELAPPGYRPPQVTLPSLAQGTLLAEPMLLVPSIAASRRIALARYLLDGQEAARADAPPFQHLLDPVALAPGQHRLRLEVTDELGGTAALEVAFVVAQVPPRVRLSSPAGELAPGAESLARFSGRVRLEALVVSQASVQSVRFLVNGQPLAEATAPPYAVELDPGRQGEGPLELAVIARDAAGQEGQALFRLELTAAGGPLSLPATAVAGAAVAAAAAAGALGLRLRRRSRARPTTAARAVGMAAPPSPPTEARAEAAPVQRQLLDVALAELSVHRRQDGALLRQLSLGRAPFTIGSRGGCDLVLTGEGIAPRHLRLWHREGRFMLHDLTGRGGVLVNGRPVLWAVLEDGDSIELGPYRLQLRLLSDAR